MHTYYVTVKTLHNCTFHTVTLTPAIMWNLILRSGIKQYTENGKCHAVSCGRSDSD